MMKKTGIMMAVLAMLLVLGSHIDTALAYFSTYAPAKGGYTIHLGSETEIKEKVAEWTKHVTITVDEDSDTVFVRVKAFAGSIYTLTYSDEAGTWTPGADGYIYFASPVKGGGSTDTLLIRIGDVPEKDVESFNVAVIYETLGV